MPKITTDEAEELLDQDVPFVDVRTVEEFEDGHVPGAVNVPFLITRGNERVPNPDFSAVMEKSFEPGQPLIVGCQAGGRSAKAAAALEAAGFETVYDMTAGFGGSKDPFGQAIPGWRQEGREIETDAEEDRTYAGILRLTGLDPSE